MWSPGSGHGVEETVYSGMKSGAGRDNLEGSYAGADSLLDAATEDYTGDNVVEDDPLAEFEAWIASGAVEIVDKL